MEINDLFTGNKNEITLKIKPCINNEKFKKYDEVKVSFVQEKYWLVDSTQGRIEIVGIGPEDNANLDIICLTHSIVKIMSNNEKKIELKVRLFNEKITMSEPIEIGFGDIILDDVDKRYSRQIKDNNKIQWFEKQLIIDTYYGMIILITPINENFRIFGKDVSVDISKRNSKFEIIRIINNNNNKNLKPSTIMLAKVSIKDISKTSKIKKEVSSALSKLNDNEKYLGTWKKYQKIEKEITLKKQSIIGFLSLDYIEKIDDEKYKIYYKEDNNSSNWLNLISKDDCIELTCAKEFSSKEKKAKAILLEKAESFIKVSTNSDLEDKNKKNDLKYAILSIAGDSEIQKRRDQALELLMKNQSPIPQLSTILEGLCTSSIELRQIKPLTVKVKKEFGEFGPNEKQEEALDIALNTPDIVVIQGPPGTGKTKVITALAKRLVEDAKDKNFSFEKEILLTAFQHDAVENMASRSSVLGLPTIKFGKKNSRVDGVSKWVKDTIEYIEAQQNFMNPNEDEFIYYDLKNNYINYIETLDSEMAKKFFLNFSKIHMVSLPIEILNKITLLTQVSIVNTNEITKELEKFIRNIRTNLTSYADDGEYNLERFIRKYSFYLAENEIIPKMDSESIHYLKNMLNQEFPNDEELLRLEEIKLNYLDQLISGFNVDKINLPSQEIEKLFQELINFYSQKIKRSGSAYSVLSEYLNDLNSSKEYVTQTIESYSALLAATIQGTKSKELTNLKSNFFNTVIVDEAARANPLDLIIPMTSAKRRIVLVGDHRQLPHMVDENIQNDLAGDKEISSQYVSHLENSLFERLFVKLKTLGMKPGAKTRVVTLDVQYRMHPVIGDFISRTFYERHGDPKIKSGIEADKLLHGIKKYKDKVAVSINLPNNRGKEEKDRGSTYRLIEAREAIKVAKEILDEDPTLSVGVITFYSKQVEELNFQAVDMKLAEKNEKNEFQIVKEYAKTQRQEERFRIGSVDAFQGKEFDVVILSLVRSNNNISIKSKYGFLTSYNRLNVAMSRAKKLLIVIGDEEMFKDSIAEESVYGLFAFYKELIGSEYGISFKL